MTSEVPQVAAVSLSWNVLFPSLMICSSAWEVYSFPFQTLRFAVINIYTYAFFFTNIQL